MLVKHSLSLVLNFEKPAQQDQLTLEAEVAVESVADPDLVVELVSFWITGKIY